MPNSDGGATTEKVSYVLADFTQAQWIYLVTLNGGQAVFKTGRVLFSHLKPVSLTSYICKER